MMRITILGWYGTETIGDRAILAGILRIFSETFTEFDIKLGSLVPEFSQRTILEDGTFYENISEKKLTKISLFNSLNPRELQDSIKHSDLVIVGGGPLMDIVQMHMLDYAFKYAKKHKIKTSIIGCGWGPLKTKEFINTTCSIISNSDLIIFRDAISLNHALEALSESIISKKSITSSIDPAVFCADYYKNSLYPESTQNYIAVNFRDISKDQYGGSAVKNEEVFIALINKLLIDFNLPVYLVPMHTFFIGGDDREILNKISFKINDSKLSVFNNPPSLCEVMALYREAACCIGMRFHSILLQTVLNGNNYILDYTDHKNGKIIGLMKELQMTDFYKSRYLSLTKPDDSKLDITLTQKFQINSSLIKNYKETYIKFLSNLFQ